MHQNEPFYFKNWEILRRGNQTPLPTPHPSPFLSSSWPSATRPPKLLDQCPIAIATRLKVVQCIAAWTKQCHQTIWSDAIANCYPLNKADTRSLDFAVTRFLMKTFRTVNIDVINECRFYFDFMLPMLLVKRKSNFLRKFNSCSSMVCHFGFAKCVKCVWQLFIYFFIS